MTNHVVRLYALAAGLLVLFLAWAAVAARPWATHARAARDPRIAALVAREQRLRHEALVVRRVVALRWRRYRIALATRQQVIAAAQSAHQRAVAAAQLAAAAPAASPSSAPSVGSPSVRVVSLPPLTITRTS